MKQTKNASPLIHDEALINDHESKLNDLKTQGKTRGQRLTELEKKVEEGFILLFDALGVREKTNGERKKQVEQALARISEIGEKAENEDKNLRELLLENKVSLARLEGIMLGQDKREAVETKQHDDEIKQEELENADKKWHLDRFDKYLIGTLTSIVAICGIVAGLLIR
ncbi:hypothetical protein [Methanobacterium spitsbergense]|uniref:Uncharacterized protein n=1 Tax=Methanobacterium spitsbergense TaxID=2874285 RepID=A0A8T5V3V0_9EURY|nr:hypothetical protein [Methanobacterium spitsbergense]MBZ2166335.1 hypothetical protein [Methanobacterium spitsbergense]